MLQKPACDSCFEAKIEKLITFVLNHIVNSAFRLPRWILTPRLPDYVGQCFIGDVLGCLYWCSSPSLLQGTLKRKLKEIRTHNDCSLLIVSVMSHGRIGMIYDGEDKGLPIDDIILQVNNGLPSHIPVVSHNNYIIYSMKIYTEHNLATWLRPYGIKY